MNVALVGIGAHMLEHILPAIRLLYGVRIVGAVTRTKNKANLIQSIDASCEVFNDLPTLLNSDLTLDVVVCCGPPDYQAKVIELCISANCHVFIEKPTCLDVERLELLQQDAEARGILIFTGYNFLFSNLYTEYKDELSKTKPLHEEIAFYSNKPTEPIWGLDCVEKSFVLAIGVHAISLAYDRLGSNLKLERKLKGKGTYFYSEYVLGNGDNCVSLKFTNAYPYFDWRLFYLSDQGNTLETQGNNLLSKVTKVEDKFISNFRQQRTFPSLKLNIDNIGYRRQLEHMFDIVRSITNDKINTIHKRDLTILRVCLEMIGDETE